MSVDWDVQLIDTVKANMCTGCKFEKICHPKESESSMEFINWEQFCQCTDKNIRNTYRPSVTPESWA